MLRRLASGYRVLTIDGVEVGVIDELDPQPMSRLWIRQRGVFRSRRTSVSVRELEAVNSDDAIVVLRIGSAAYGQLARPSGDERTPPAEGSRAGEDEAAPDEDSAASGLVRATPERAEEPTTRPVEREPARSEYLLFIGTAGGYVLVEHDTAPGVAGDLLDLPDLPEARFQVTKLGPSPLPGDDRRCAYLQPVR